jgi:hypothetical protein
VASLASVYCILQHPGGTTKNVSRHCHVPLVKLLLLRTFKRLKNIKITMYGLIWTFNYSIQKVEKNTHGPITELYI